MPRVQHKRGTSANLASVNPTPLAGELVFVSDENAIKVGDGTTAYTSLAYVTATPRSHNHDDRYYTETEVDGFLAGKAAASHTHTFSQISDITFPSPLQDNSIVRYTSGSGWGVANAIGTIGVGSQPLGGWPTGSVGASLASKVADNDARLSDARTPTAHKSSHATGGSDALAPADIGAAPAASPTFTGTVTVPGLTSTGVILADDVATANSVAYSFDGDPNTGIGRGGADILTVVTNGAERVRVDASGHAAIGTTPTTRRLTVRGGGVSDGAVLLQSSSTGTGTSNGFIIQCFGASSDAYVWNFENAPVIFGANNAERMRLTAAGDLGLGPSRTAPASRLDVNGVITVSAGTAAAPALVASGDSNTGAFFPAADTFAISTAGAERVRVDASGRVGIGVSPSHALDVASASAVSARVRRATVGGQANLRIEDGNGSYYDLATVNNALAFMSNASERMRIDASGRIGIGAVTPTALLDVNSDTMRLRTARTPASATAAGNAGDICWDAEYLYICIANAQWRRVAHATW